MEPARTRRENEVWQACDDLWADIGAIERITGDAIRDRLSNLGYKKGSPNEIYKYRRTWRLSRGIRETGPEPADIEQNDPISRAVALVHEQLRTQSRNDIERLQQEYENKLAAQQTKLEDALKAVELLQTKLVDLENRSAALTHERDGLKQLLADETKLRELTQARLDASEKNFAGLKKETEEWKLGFHAHMQDMLAQKDAQLTEISQKLKDQGALAMDEANGLKVQLRNFEIEAVTAANFLKQKDAKINDLREQIDHLKEELATGHIKQSRELGYLQKRVNQLGVENARLGKSQSKFGQSNWRQK